MKDFIQTIRHWLEYLGGAAEQRPKGFPGRADWLVMGLWWCGLAVLIAFCCGQSSKFIYIDF